MAAYRTLGELFVLLYTGKDFKFRVLLVGDFPQRPILSLSHACTNVQQPDQTNVTTECVCPTRDPP